jgi:hypothetical protein
MMNDGWTQANFWSTAGQIIPVLGLALVIEARAVARTWTLEKKTQRRIEAAVVAVLAFSLSLSFGATLNALGSAQDEPRWKLLAVSLVLQFAFGVIAVNAAFMVFSLGVSDSTFMMLRRLTFPITIRARKRLKSMADEIDGLLESTGAVVDQAEIVVTSARRRSKDRSRLSSGEISKLADFLKNALEDAGAEEYVQLFLVPELKIELDKYLKRPSQAQARRTRFANLHVAIRLLAHARLRRVGLFDVRARIFNNLADLNYRRLSTRNIDTAAALIAQASEPRLFPSARSHDF